jgi:solute carrier family 27 fatty acid transporter 1/4
MYGNGLSPTIWKTFSERFGIPKIGEFYGSTEGNCTVINTDSKVGSVGFLPRAVYPILPTSLVKVNEETGEILRNSKTNRVIPCKPNESGELIGKIVIGNPLRDFQGYADKSAGESKIIREAFRKGDAWFRSGDILIMDEYGYFYFKDRTGMYNILVCICTL